MPKPHYDKLYDRLKPPERLTLYIEAMSRDDAAESSRLESSCPRGTYTGPDPQFYQRLMMAFDTMAVVTIDLKSMWGQLEMLHWFQTEVLRALATTHNINATLAFLDGAYCGQGLPQIHFFAKPLEDRPRSDDEEVEEEVDRPQAKWHADRGRRMAAVQERAEHFTAQGVVAVALSAVDVAQDLVETWAAFGLFCRTRVGVTPQAMLGAWRFPVADFEQTLQRYARLKPDPAKVKEYTRHICVNWDRRFNPARGFDTDGGGDGKGDDEAEGGDGDGE